MAWSKKKPTNPVKPGRWLGFFFWIIVLAGSLVIVIELVHLKPVEDRPFGFDATKWLTFLAGWGTILGAFTTARIMLSNAIKQHTIATLLEMRMSEAYMTRSKAVGNRYYSDDGIYVITDSVIQRNSPEDVLGDVTYLLNYYEFIASAIRYGDLDENLLKESLRGMLCNTYELARFHISYRRTKSSKPNPLLYEHLEWLYMRWYIQGYQRPILIRSE